MDITLVTVDSDTGEISKSNVLSNSGCGVFEEVRYATECGVIFSKELIMKHSIFFDVVDESDYHDFVIEVNTGASKEFSGFGKKDWRFFIKINDDHFRYHSVEKILEDMLKTTFRFLSRLCGG